MDLFLKICWLGDLEELMSLEGKVWLEIDNSGCLGDLVSRIVLLVLFVRNLPPLNWPTVELNFALRPHPKWPVMSGRTFAGKLPSKSGCRLLVHLAGWELFHQSCWEWGTDKFSQQCLNIIIIIIVIIIIIIIISIFALFDFRGPFPKRSDNLSARNVVLCLPCLHSTSEFQ